MVYSQRNCKDYANMVTSNLIITGIINDWEFNHGAFNGFTLWLNNNII